MKRRILCSILVLVIVLPASAQVLKKMEFRNQPIVDILLSLAQAAEVSILPDETVSGNASFYFSEAQFEDSLRLFLQTNKLSYVREGKVYYVSRISAAWDAQKGLATLRAEEVDIQLLVRALSKAMGKTILYDSLPRAPLTINAESMAPMKTLEMLIAKFPEYKIEQKDDSWFYIKRIQAETRDSSGNTIRRPLIKRTGDSYSISLEKGRYLDAVQSLFAQSGKEYSLLSRTDTALENLYFADRDFESMLRLILEQGNADYVIHNGVYYIFDVQKRDVLKKLKRTEIIPLKFQSAQELIGFLPSDLAGGNLYKVDKATNSVILMGSGEEIDPIRQFIISFDRPNEGMSYRRFDLRYVKAKDILALIPAKLLPVAPILLPDGASFIALLPDGGSPDLEKFISSVDRKTEGFPVRLRYLKNEEFLKFLPPSVSKEDLVDSGSNGLIFFVGSEDKRKLFLRELALLDRPKPQIRYDILVLQLIKSNSFDWKNPISFKNSTDGSLLSFTGGTLRESAALALNIDALALFGYQFTVDLSSSIVENKARVARDTAINGLSGQKLSFRNTETFHYNASNTDTNGNVTIVSKEISSGLIFSIDGWVSGDGMVTIALDATVSDQTQSSSTSSNELPRTTEKVISTSVRTPSGKPIVIGGLLKTSDEKSYSKVPLLGDVPGLGPLFRTNSDKMSDTEIVIYLVPHVNFDYDADPMSAGRRMESYYANYVSGQQ